LHRAGLHLRLSRLAERIGENPSVFLRAAIAGEAALAIGLKSVTMTSSKDLFLVTPQAAVNNGPEFYLQSGRKSVAFRGDP